jgi:hypothetical protein
MLYEILIAIVIAIETAVIKYQMIFLQYIYKMGYYSSLLVNILKRYFLSFQMAALRKTKRQEIPFILDGTTIMKTITNNTTCSDVISKLPNLQTPLAVFESVDGIEKELAGKTKLLKVWRGNGSTRNVTFVIRKSQMLSKVKRSSKTKSSDVKNGKQLRKELSKDTLKQVSDLAFYVRYQKTKLQALEQNSDIKSNSSEQNRLMKRMTSHASVNSMDAFLAKADLNEMAKFLTFCGEVTDEKLGKEKPRNESEQIYTTPVCDREQPTGCSKPENKCKKQVIRTCINSTKLAFKQNFNQKKSIERTTSTGTISSTDTGYQSIDSECERIPKKSASDIGKPILNNVIDVPRHSTPVTAIRTQKRRADDIDATFNADNTIISDNFEQMNELQGKSMILQKFMADQPLSLSLECTGNDECDSPDVKRRRNIIGQYNMPTFNTQKDVCRFLWNKNCDSDSECESDISEPCETLDLAFNYSEIDNENTPTTQSRKLRRESAISNLNRFSLNAEEIISSKTKTLRRESAISNLNQFTLVPRVTEMDSSNESSCFDYSFDCSFPRMDETKSEDFSMDFSYDYDKSDCESEIVFNEDDAMDSFMRTRSFIDELGEVTAFENEQVSTSLDNSDEGLGSMTDCREPEMIL